MLSTQNTVRTIILQSQTVATNLTPLLPSQFCLTSTTITTTKIVTTSESLRVIYSHLAFFCIGNARTARFVLAMEECASNPNNDPVDVDPPTPLRQFLPNDLDSFWRYSGSLTLPFSASGSGADTYCGQIVQWSVFKVIRLTKQFMNRR